MCKRSEPVFFQRWRVVNLCGLESVVKAERREVRLPFFLSKLSLAVRIGSIKKHPSISLSPCDTVPCEVDDDFWRTRDYLQRGCGG